MTTTAVKQSIQTGIWTIDPSHSSIEFRVKHLGIATVKGTFRTFEGSIEVDAADNIAIGGTIDVASVDTREADRDAHLRSADFFDAAAHPTVTFTSTSVRVAGEDVAIDGDLTIRGITKPIRLAGEISGVETDPWGSERVALEVTGQVNRGDYGMTFNQLLGSGNLLVGDRVKLELQIEAVRAAA